MSDTKFWLIFFIRGIALVVLLMVPVALFCLGGIPDEMEVTRQIESNRAELATFKALAVKVDAFIVKNHLVPNDGEVQEADLVLAPGTKFNKPPSYPLNIVSDASNYADKSREYLLQFGDWPSQTSHPYLLVNWGYDDPLIWSSWLHKTNYLIFNPRDFYRLGHDQKSETHAFFAIVALLVTLSGLLFWAAQIMKAKAR